MCTEINKHCEIGHKRLLMSSIETENQLSYCGSTIISKKCHLISSVRIAHKRNKIVVRVTEMNFLNFRLVLFPWTVGTRDLIQER